MWQWLYFHYCNIVLTVQISSCCCVSHSNRCHLYDIRILTDFIILLSCKLALMCKILCLLQTWKNETVAEQEKRSPKERPVLLSKDIESKLSLLDREVNYLLNKAKFAKPKAKPKGKNSTSSDKSSKANTTAEEQVIPPTKESTDTNSGKLNCRTHMAVFFPHCEHKELFYNIYPIPMKRAQMRCSRARPRPLRRALSIQKQTARHSRQKTPQLQVRLLDSSLVTPDNQKGCSLLLSLSQFVLSFPIHNANIMIMLFYT